MTELNDGAPPKASDREHIDALISVLQDFMAICEVMPDFEAIGSDEWVLMFVAHDIIAQAKGELND